LRPVPNRILSHISDNKSLLIEAHVSDFRLIKYRGKQLRAKDFNRLHAQSIDFLKTSIPESKAKHKIVVSHHVPSQMVNPTMYKDADINPAFISEQKDLILELQPDYWIYGHHHANMPETTIKKTKSVTNQLGYVQITSTDTMPVLNWSKTSILPTLWRNSYQLKEKTFNLVSSLALRYLHFGILLLNAIVAMTMLAFMLKKHLALK
jgi:hypothetical protein